MAGVMRSVVQNYLNKVVGRRTVSKSKIAFMGATARNKGLVAAFEQRLGLGESVLDLQRRAQASQGLGHVRMLGPKGLLPCCQSAL